MKQQTAVEWFVKNVESISNNKSLTKKESIKLYNQAIKQAKEMEEQQMLEFWNGGIDCTEGGVCFDQYYNETYKKE